MRLVLPRQHRTSGPWRDEFTPEFSGIARLGEQVMGQSCREAASFRHVLHVFVRAQHNVNHLPAEIAGRY